MSQPDLVAQLREARLAAPPDLRERVRSVAARSAPAPRRVTRRRAVAVAVPLAAALAAAVVVLLPRGGHHAPTTTPAPSALRSAAPKAAVKAAGALSIRDAAAQATGIVRSLGGRPLASTVGASAADLRYRVPPGKVAEAVRRLSQLGRVTSTGVTVELRLSRS